MIAKWGTILWAFYIKYMPRTYVKDQVLFDLVVEFAETPSKKRVEGLNTDEKLVGMVLLHGTLCLGGYMLLVL